MFIIRGTAVIALAKQFATFFVVGCGSAVGHYGLLILLVQGFAMDAVLATIPASLLGAVINYFLNYRYTFKSDKRHQEAIAKFSFIAAIGLCLNAFFMWLGHDRMHLGEQIIQAIAATTTIDIPMHHAYLLVQIVTTILVMVWGFFGNRLWTFRVSSAIDQT